MNDGGKRCQQTIERVLKCDDRERKGILPKA